MRAAAEFAVHGVDAQFHSDLDGAAPVLDRRLAFGFVGAGPAVHRQKRGDADVLGRQRLLEGADAVGEYAGGLEPFEEVAARAHLDPVVAQLAHLARQLLQTEMAVHEGVERDLHRLFLGR